MDQGIKASVLGLWSLAVSKALLRNPSRTRFTSTLLSFLSVFSVSLSYSLVGLSMAGQADNEVQRLTLGFGDATITVITGPEVLTNERSESGLPRSGWRTAPLPI